LACGLTSVFYKDIKDAEKIDARKWEMRPWDKKFIEKTARL